MLRKIHGKLPQLVTKESNQICYKWLRKLEEKTHKMQRKNHEKLPQLATKESNQICYNDYEYIVIISFNWQQITVTQFVTNSSISVVPINYEYRLNE